MPALLAWVERSRQGEAAWLETVALAREVAGLLRGKGERLDELQRRTDLLRHIDQINTVLFISIVALAALAAIVAVRGGL